MHTSIVLTVMADDRPGIIKTVSAVLTDHGGNWTQSSMSSLAGQFAGILLVSMPSENTEACIAELQDLESKGLRIIAHVCSGPVEEEKSNTYILNLVGNDRPGIVHEITTLLAKHKVSVHQFETAVESAAMGGADLFKATAQLLIPDSADIDQIENELEDLANDLMVDIRFT